MCSTRVTATSGTASAARRLRGHGTGAQTRQEHLQRDQDQSSALWVEGGDSMGSGHPNIEYISDGEKVERKYMSLKTKTVVTAVS